MHDLALSLLLAASAAEDAAPSVPTWSEAVAAVVHRRCAACHRPDQAAPFALLDYEDARKRARTIARVVESGRMPPWPPAEGHGEFKDSRRLDEGERALLLAWVAAGAPAGDLERAPAPPEFTSDWSLGAPDLVTRTEVAFPVPADGPDVYRSFVLPVGLAETRWVRAIEVRPSARSVVHHALFFHDTSGRARAADAEDELPGFEGMALGGLGRLGGWAVGAGPYRLPEGLALELPAGADLVVQAHFHPNGKAQSERTEFALVFADGPPAKPVVSFLLPPEYGAFAGLDIPADDPDWHLRDSFRLPVDTELHLVGAHAHYLGKELRAWAVRPDGSEERLFAIDDWDFRWQGSYEYARAVALPAGSEVFVDLSYDNSAGNPENPSTPPRRVTWGLESFDEMGAVSFVATAARVEDSEALRAAVREKRAAARRERVAVSIDWYARVMRLDRDGDGKLAREEIPATAARALERLDRDGDGELSAQELERLKERSDGAQRD